MRRGGVTRASTSTGCPPPPPLDWLLCLHIKNMLSDKISVTIIMNVYWFGWRQVITPTHLAGGQLDLIVIVLHVTQQDRDVTCLLSRLARNKCISCTVKQLIRNELGDNSANEFRANWLELKFQLIIIGLTLFVNRAQNFPFPICVMLRWFIHGYWVKTVSTWLFTYLTKSGIVNSIFLVIFCLHVVCSPVVLCWPR